MTMKPNPEETQDCVANWKHLFPEFVYLLKIFSHLFISLFLSFFFIFYDMELMISKVIFI